MSSNLLVSVIINFLNTEQFIEEAVESVLLQTYSNWELLLVDDGSTDKSTEIALHYKQQFPEKIRYLEHEGHQNLGASAARNLGIYHTKGEYIAFLDADDIWLPNYLDQMVAILNAQPRAAMVYANTLKWYSWKDDTNDKLRDHAYELGVQTNRLIEPPILFNLLIKGQASAPCTCSIVIRRKSLEKVNGFEDFFRGMYDDQVLYAKIFLKEAVFVADGCWAKYRKHENSCVSVARRTGQADSARFIFLNWLENYLLEQNFTHTEAWQSLQKALWPYRHPTLHKIGTKVQWLLLKAGKSVKRLFRSSPLLET